MKQLKNLFWVLVTAASCPVPALAIAITITGDSDKLLTGNFQSQFALSATGRGHDSGSFAASYWSGELYLNCSPDVNTWISFVPTFDVRHSPLNTGGGLEGNYESMFRSDSPWSSLFSFQPYGMIYPPNGEWFVMHCSYTFDPNSRMLNVNGTFEATLPGATSVPEGGSTFALSALALATMVGAKALVKTQRGKTG